MTLAATLKQVPANTSLRIVLTVLDEQSDKQLDAAEQLAASGAAPQELKPEGFAIRHAQQGAQNTYGGLGADSDGVMSGGLELAEIISANGLRAVKDDEQNPYMDKRGTKFNCPLDLRTPSYSDMSDAGQQKIEQTGSWEPWADCVASQHCCLPLLYCP